MLLAKGTKLGPYEISGSVGAGGMGEVYRAHDPRLKRDVAIKVLPPTFSQDPERLRRFEQEAHATAALSHPNVLAIFDLGTYQGSPYIVSELLHGETLRQKLSSGPMSLRNSVEMAIQIASGLSAAHEHGIIHRDLKPENIFITRDGTAKVLDFGLAKLTSDDLPDASTRTNFVSSTSPGMILGTIGYMAPEQIRGGAIDARTDIFAFGTVFYEMLSGRMAFKADTVADTMTAILTSDPPELSSEPTKLPIAADHVVRHCLEKKPQDRFQSARDLIFGLRLLSSPSTASSGSFAAPSAPRERSRLAWAIPLSFVVLVLVVLLIGVTRLAIPHPKMPLYKKLTSRRGVIGGARFGPDGNTIYYDAAWEHRPYKVYRGTANSVDAQLLNLPDAHVLAVSRSGELAVLVAKSPTEPDSRLARVSPGGAPREILDDVLSADWSPSGELAVTHFQDGRCRVEYPIGHVLFENLGYIDGLRFSPKGNALAFLEHPLSGDDRGFVSIVDLQGKHHVLTREWEGESGIAWRPDGQEIWFSASEGDNYQLHGVTLEGKLRQIVQIPDALLLQDISDAGLLLFVANRGRYDVVYGEPGASHQVSWSDIMLSSAVSRDGKRVVVSDMAGTNYSTYLAQLDGSPAVLLGSGFATFGSLSPDDKYVATIVPTELSSIQLLPASIGETRHLHGDNFRYREAAWAHDGRRLIVTASQAGHPYRTWVQGLDGSAPRAVTPEEITGRTVLLHDTDYVCARSSSGSLELYPLDGGTPLPVLGAQPSDEVLGSAPPGDLLYVTPDSSAMPMQVDQLDPKTGHRQRLLTISPVDPAGVVRLSNPLILPDRKHWIVSQESSMSVLYVARDVR